MVTASFKDFCVDATDPVPVAAFWAAALGGTVDPGPGGVIAVRNMPLTTWWLVPVPEPKTVKNRVHPDLHADVEELRTIGAHLVAERPHWTVMADPEGNEFCAFPWPDGARPADGQPARLFSLCVDAADPAPLAAWWHERLGGELGPGPDGVLRRIHGGRGLGEVVFNVVPVADPRTAKNRTHWDVVVADHTALDALVRSGATIERSPDAAIWWTVCRDPDGNEFCVFVES